MLKADRIEEPPVQAHLEALNGGEVGSVSFISKHAFSWPTVTCAVRVCVGTASTKNRNGVPPEQTEMASHASGLKIHRLF